MKRLLSVLLISLVAVLGLTACKDVPGEDGRYAHQWRRDFP